MDNINKSIINIIGGYKELIHDRLENIEYMKKDLGQEYELINKTYKRIDKTIKHIIKLQREYNYCYHMELMMYFYNPDKVYKFLLENPNKHVEDM